MLCIEALCGVAVLVREGVQNVSLDLMEYVVEKDCEVAGSFLPDYKLMILSCYRSPSGDFQSFLNILESVFSTMNLHDNKIILTGDFNVRFNDSNNVEAALLCDFLAAFGLHTSFADPTRLGNCLDNAFSNFSVLSCIMTYFVAPR